MKLKLIGLLLKLFIVLFLEISEGRVLTHRADSDWNEAGGAARNQPTVRRQTATNACLMSAPQWYHLLDKNECS